MTSPAFLLIHAQITHPAQFAAYAQAVQPLVQQFGGQYRVLGGEQITLEGETAAGWRVVISEWPSRSAALAFWHSPDYAAIRPLRDGAAVVRVQLLDGQALLPLQ
ncbi:DUF1330 domain-containing protein [Spirulina sp. CCNP1310]|uniref:DUF1330 domain-containing protein n=1 Tax=Spirulina sp. CCNP1310 TaxID=3110249 RepID=UPI002B1F0E28|nr:DUF1330 domain-containing protein [Spirulina sp. CCNP1310]MEA5420285.1 DUF1330 domain-containing protein [Spirulina sp. CCNP1310]